jgi:hypothetical protein
VHEKQLSVVNQMILVAYTHVSELTLRIMGLSSTFLAAFLIFSQSNLLHTLFVGFAGSITNGL